MTGHGLNASGTMPRFAQVSVQSGGTICATSSSACSSPQGNTRSIAEAAPDSGAEDQPYGEAEGVEESFHRVTAGRFGLEREERDGLFI